MDAVNNPLNCTIMQRLFDLEVCKTCLSLHLIARNADSLLINPQYSRQDRLHRLVSAILRSRVTSQAATCAVNEAINKNVHVSHRPPLLLLGSERTNTPRESLPRNSWWGSAACFSKS